MRIPIARLLALAASVLATAAPAMELNPLFQDHAVLQSDGEKITVSFGGQSVTTTGKGGAWNVLLDPMRPDATPRKLTVSGDTTCELDDILVGEVWVASRQSNMERRLGLRSGQQPITGWENEVAAADHPQIRQFDVTQTKSLSPQTTVKGEWTVCPLETVVDLSAVAYFFASDLLASRKVPVGIIHSSWGGTPAETRTSGAGSRTLPDFAEPLAEVKRFIAVPNRRGTSHSRNQ